MNEHVYLGGWPASVRQQWARVPLCLDHALHHSTLFSDATLYGLIEHYPRDHLSLIQTAGSGEPQRWEAGALGPLSGHQVMEAVVAGQYWLNLRCVETVDVRYAELLQQLIGELAMQLGQPVTDFSQATLGILMSSPHAEVYYHSDLPNQSLWQIRGSKTVWIYPAQPPFVTRRDLEDIAIFESEFKLTHQPSFESAATAMTLTPGKMLSWPLNAPHRVVNEACVNVSLTLEYWSRQAQRSQQLNMANGVLRHRFGWQQLRTQQTGVGFRAKVLLYALLYHTGIVRDWLAHLRATGQVTRFHLDSDQAEQRSVKQRGQ